MEKNNKIKTIKISLKILFPKISNILAKAKIG